MTTAHPRLDPQARRAQWVAAGLAVLLAAGLLAWIGTRAEPVDLVVGA